jgi:nucleoside-diphosphate-sugar epimerase
MAAAGSRLDIAYAIACAIEAPKAGGPQQVFNVGETSENYQVRQIAQIVADVFPGCKLTLWDERRRQPELPVNFDKIHSTLTGFKCQRNAEGRGEELLSVFQSIGMSAGNVQFSRLHASNS